MAVDRGSVALDGIGYDRWNVAVGGFTAGLLLGAVIFGRRRRG